MSLVCNARPAPHLPACPIVAKWGWCAPNFPYLKPEENSHES